MKDQRSFKELSKEIFDVKKQCMNLCNQLGKAPDRVLTEPLIKGKRILVSHGQCHWDFSVTQFVILGYAAADNMARKHGMAYDKKAVEKAAKYLINLYFSKAHREGSYRGSVGWGYNGGQASQTMSPAGYGSMQILKRLVKNKDAIATCEKLIKGSDKYCSKLKLQSQIGGPKNNVQSHRYGYLFYTIEKAGSLSGQDKIFGFDWYDEGARSVLKIQDEQFGLLSESREQSLSYRSLQQRTFGFVSLQGL